MFPWLACPLEYDRSKHIEFASLSKVQDQVNQALASLLCYSRKHSAYYAAFLPSCKDIERDPFSALKTVPLLTKEVLRVRSGDIRTARWRLGVRKNYSGGSTGEPVLLFQDARYRRWVRANKMIFDAWTGYSPGDRRAVLWAARRDLQKKRSAHRLITEWFRNSFILDAYTLDDNSISGYIETIERERPVQLQGYAESLYQLARHALRQGANIDGVGAVLSTAGTLYPDMRSDIERAFGCKVFNRYGSREVGDIACECQCGSGLHMNPLMNVIEILDDDGNSVGLGRKGRVVVTSLVNYAMPLIRYDIGDIAELSSGECSCGRSWPMLRAVEGRVTENIVGINGRVVYGGWLRTQLYDCPWIVKYQWTQRALDRLVLKVVVDPGFEDCPLMQLEQVLRAEIKAELGGTTELEVIVVDHIDPSPSGKHLYVVSELDKTD